MPSDMVRRGCAAVHRKDLNDDQRIQELEALERDYPDRGWAMVLDDARRRREKKRQQALPLTKREEVEDAPF